MWMSAPGAQQSSGLKIQLPSQLCHLHGGHYQGNNRPAADNQENKWRMRDVRNGSLLSLGHCPAVAAQL